MRVTAEWALRGKRPGTRGGDEILAFSPGRFSRDDFDEIIARFTPGATANLPRVTASWVGGGASAHVGLAVQAWSNAKDGLGRDIAVTRYFCVPYAQLAGGAVSYGALYDALAGCALPADGPLTVEVPAFDAGQATAADETVMCAAALLLTGDPVCVVNAEAVPLLSRLRFLDAVASLLPYGFRSKLTASTWTDSATKHRIRLSFSRHASPGAHAVAWGGRVPIAGFPDMVRRYHSTVANCGDLADLMARFARETEPRSIRAADFSEILDLTGGIGAEPAAGPPPTGDRAVDEILAACADSVDQADTRRLAQCMNRLASVRRDARGGDHTRAHRDLIRDRRLLVTAQSLDERTQERLYDLVLGVAYGSRLTLSAFEEIRQNANHWVPPPLAASLRRMTAAEPAVTLRLAVYLGQDDLRSVLASLTSEKLIAAAVREPLDPQAMHAMCSELTSRGDAPGNRAAVRDGLRRRGRLVTAVHRLHPDDPDGQVWRFHGLLTAVYGPALDRSALDKDFLSDSGPPSVSLLAALTMMCAPEVRHELVESVFTDLLVQAGITGAVLDQIRAEPGEPPPRQRPGRRFSILNRERWRT